MPNALKRPPLVREERVKTHPDTGDLLHLQITRRGVLSESRCSLNGRLHLRTLLDALYYSAKKDLEDLRDSLRMELRHAALPTDETPHWIKLDDGDWQPYRPVPGTPAPENVTAY